MMKVFLLSLFLLLSFSLSFGQSPEQLSLRNGQQKTTKNGRITVKFVELIEDSRCPTDVNCVWAGVARIKLRLTKNGKSEDFELNTNQTDKTAVFGGCSIALTSLEPRQSTTSKYSRSAYTATIVVSKVGR